MNREVEKVNEIYDLTGKVAVVTGSVRGIGRAIAGIFAEFGASVVVTARRQEVCDAVADELRSGGARAIGVGCDITGDEGRRGLIAKAIETFGRIDILVNNAGTGGKEAPILTIEEEEWDSTMGIDLKAVYFLSRLAAQKMKDQGCEAGTIPYRIINMASAAGIKAPKYASVYGAAKAGVIHLTKIMANEWARYGVTVNAVAPGYVYTDMTKAVMADEKNAAVVKKMIAMRRFAAPEEIAAAVEFLASPAGGYITGITLPVDGGMTIN